MEMINKFIKKPIYFVPVVAVFLLLLIGFFWAMAHGDNGTYVYKGDVAFMTDAKVTVVIDGKSGTVTTKGKALGLTDSKDTESITVDQKNNTIDYNGDKLTYEIKSGKLTFDDDGYSFLEEKTFEKQ